jgi:hypothetical protein
MCGVQGTSVAGCDTLPSMPATDLAVIPARMFAGPLLVTVAYVCVYYAMIGNQLRVKTRLRRAYRARGETFDRYFGNDREMLAADR